MNAMRLSDLDREFNELRQLMRKAEALAEINRKLAVMLQLRGRETQRLEASKIVRRTPDAFKQETKSSTKTK